MGKAPAVIVIARHGARLDAADLQWHLTSPTPYDPPLTYGGWKQAQALGARIASIIKFREDTSEKKHSFSAAFDGGSGSTHHSRESRRRKHRVIVHSSPFLRCVQTSIGISAGLQYWNGVLEAEARSGHPKNHKLHSGSPHLHASDHRSSPHLSAIPEPEEDSSKCAEVKHPANTKRDRAALAMLRLDAFLGEWLSPDYFENITPPPGSKMMVAGAKADLLRRGDPIEAVHQEATKPNGGNFPGGWKGHKLEDHKDPAPMDMSELESSLPKLVRANTHSAFHSLGRTNRHLTSRIDGGSTGAGHGYSPPIPSYAVSPVQTIPQGYVTHARDACMRIDYQWDSMRPPLDWGGGGEYGEEWSAMHRRFRKGLDDMISWYSNGESRQIPGDGAGGIDALRHVKSNPLETEDEDGEDTVLVLVTHGAGCNALIGALTNQPVLIDVGLGSLTMAVRKHTDARSAMDSSYRPSQLSHRRRSSFNLGLSEDYDVKLTASTDHMRAGSQFLAAQAPRARSPSLPVREKSPYRYERHVGSPTRQHATKSPVRDTLDPKSSRHSVGSFEEDKSSGRAKRANTTAGSSRGLWSKPAPRKADSPSPADAVNGASSPQKNPGDGDRGRMGHEASTSTLDRNGDSAGDRMNPSTLTQPGLWTADPKMNGHVKGQTTPKRRWTASHA